MVFFDAISLLIPPQGVILLNQLKPSVQDPCRFNLKVYQTQEWIIVQTGSNPMIISYQICYVYYSFWMTSDTIRL